MTTQKNYAQGFTILTIVVVANLLSFFEILSIMQFRLERDETNLPVLYFQGFTVAITNQIIYLIAGYIYFFRYILRRQIRFYNAMITINLALASISLLARVIAIILCKRDKDGRPDFVNLETIGMIVDVVLCYIVFSWKNASVDEQVVEDVENATTNSFTKRKVIQQEPVIIVDIEDQKTVVQNKTEAEDQKTIVQDKIETEDLKVEIAVVGNKDQSTTVQGNPESEDQKIVNAAAEEILVLNDKTTQS